MKVNGKMAIFNCYNLQLCSSKQAQIVVFGMVKYEDLC